jgi:hypothetical protein
MRFFRVQSPGAVERTAETKTASCNPNCESY